MNLKDTIGIFDKAFTPEECNLIKERFERAKTLKLTYSGQSGSGENDTIKSSTDFDLLTSPIEDDVLFGYSIIEKLNEFVVNDYLSETFPFQDESEPAGELFNSDTFYELLQVQEYQKGSGHYHAWHAETGTFEMSRRLFSFILYLDNVEEGGETDFLYADNGDGKPFSVKPEVGKLVIWPASFPYVHRGRTPISGNKTILTTWLSYEPGYEQY